MTIPELINLIVNNGIAIVVVAYFLFINYKFNQELVTTLAKINEKLEKGAQYHD